MEVKKHLSMPVPHGKFASPNVDRKASTWNIASQAIQQTVQQVNRNKQTSSHLTSTWHILKLLSTETAGNTEGCLGQCGKFPKRRRDGTQSIMEEKLRIISNCTDSARSFKMQIPRVEVVPTAMDESSRQWPHESSPAYTAYTALEHSPFKVDLPIGLRPFEMNWSTTEGRGFTVWSRPTETIWNELVDLLMWRLPQDVDKHLNINKQNRDSNDDCLDDNDPINYCSATQVWRMMLLVPVLLSYYRTFHMILVKDLL